MPIREAEHPNVMISSTWADLAEHRKAVFDALLRLGFFPIGMEFDSAKAGRDIMESSLEMVDQAHAYVGILSHRYGGVPEDSRRNPEKLSITELEYRRALERGIPVYMYLMSDDHPVKRVDVESVEEYQKKLAELRADAKRRSICAEFLSVEGLKGLVLQSLHEFKTDLRAPERSEGEPRLPEPPKLLAIPDFISGQAFVGRLTELEWLDQWAAGADPLMVIEAIGGAGKSALAWEWLTLRARKAIPSFAGAIWYSFNEGGADMTDFAAHALAYTTGESLKEFRGRKTADLARLLTNELHENRWLLVLDGCERVLVAYHRFDASQARDDQVASDADHRACIKPADADLLRQLVGVTASKILVTSRLMPADLANHAGGSLPGVQHRQLRGMHPDDALRLMHGLDIRGEGQAIRRYLTENFDNHPLLLGIIAGLVNDYFRDPGNFDRWVDDHQGGAGLHLAKLQIEQRHTHILAAALNGLEPDVRKLLSHIGAFPVGVAFEDIEALSPFPDLPGLVAGLRELERRGLLHWDRRKNSYDLHPVVRGYAFDALQPPERMDICSRIAQHLQSKAPDRYAEAKTLADVQQSIGIFRALIHANRLDEAAKFYKGDFAQALLVSLEANHEILKLLRPLFGDGFQNPPPGLARPDDQASLLNEAAVALDGLGLHSEAQQAYGSSLRIRIEQADGARACTTLSNLGLNLFDANRLRQAYTATELSLELAQAILDGEQTARSYMLLMYQCRVMGRFEEALAAYEAFRSLPVPRDRAVYRPGDIEDELCWLRFYQEALTEKLLDETDLVVQSGKDRTLIRGLILLRGEWAFLRGDLPTARTCFEKVIEMAHAVGLPAARYESRLALALVRSGDQQRAREICDRLCDLPDAPGLSLAEAYLELGDRENARQHVLAGYEWAWADGPPYARWWELKRCSAVLKALGAAEPSLPPCDAKRIEPVPYEAEVRALIAELKKPPPQ